MSREGDGGRGPSRAEAHEADPGDGRNVDPATGLLEGEGAQQAVPAHRASAEGTVPYEVWTGVPSDHEGRARQDPTYFERPVLKEPVWKWYVPAYFYTGGAAGAAAVLGAAAQVADRESLAGLVRRCRWMAAAGGAIGAFFLVVDLGRPGRFFNMLRVFRPSSPMNMGSWILSAMAPLAAGSAVFSSPGGPTGSWGDVAGLGAGLAGLPMTGYTAVLTANTAVPVWQGTRRTLAPLFVASAVSAAASILQLLEANDAEARIVRRYAILGAAGDLVSELALEREAARVDRVARPLHQGRSGLLMKASKAFTVTSLAVNLLPGRRGKRMLAGLLGTAGAVAVKFGIAEAGKASAADPRASFHQQRKGLGAAEVTGTAAVSEGRQVLGSAPTLN